MTISQKGIDLIKHFEGLRLESYRCPKGIWTIGYGHTKDVTPGMVITQDEAEAYLREDVRWCERVVNFNCAKLNQSQFDALCSFVFNVGSGNFKTSTLLRKVKKDPNDETIRGEFAKWVKANGNTLPGLVNRRKQEADMFFFK